MDREAGDSPAHLMIQDRPATGPEPHGHAVDCPRRGTVRLVECLDCEDFSTVSFERQTSETFVNCRPKQD